MGETTTRGPDPASEPASDPATGIPPAESENAAGQPVAAELPSGSPVDTIAAALGVIPPQPSLPLPRWFGPLATSVAIGIVPWIVYLALTLPGHQRTVDYDIAWVGFDCAMCVVLAALAYCALRRKPATEPLAAVAATMLVVDAWFDIVTSEEGTHLMFAVLSAVLAELPLAIICAWVAVNAERVQERAYRRLRMRWESAVQLARANGAPLDAPVVSPPRDQ
jgi:hypothetical protein